MTPTPLSALPAPDGKTPLTPIAFFSNSHTGICTTSCTVDKILTDMRNENVPKIEINNTINLFLKTAVSILVISDHNSFPVLFDEMASFYFN